MADTLILTMSCPDKVGIIAAVTGFLANHGGWITEANYHADAGSGWFFMRQAILSRSLDFSIDDFPRLIRPLEERFGLVWSLSESRVKKRTLILVSRQDHCLSDLFHRWRTGELNIEIVAVVSNHPDLESFVAWHGVPFHLVPVSPEAGLAPFEEIARITEEVRGEVMVLARYMRILPPFLCERYPGQIINIHHSFLPSFVGSRPYHQAYERGVKLIGATCHYVSAELDAGPIIDQDVIRVDHGDSPEEMARLGRDVEKMVLARGLRYHVEDRVVIHGNKTVVFA
ncbi:MAG: formyltetrahydrofolate deformylase [Nitrospiraceae bacterium]|nr:formyltetrahydrofolate deformylase [Nitrospiraceae bacterium]